MCWFLNFAMCCLIDTQAAMLQNHSEDTKLGCLWGSKIMLCAPPGAESEPGGSWGANLCIWHPKLLWHHRSREQGCGWVQLFQIYLVAMFGRWWKPKRCANAGHEALRPHHRFQAGSKEIKSASLLPCHHLCHIILQRSTPHSQKGFLLKCINLISLSCQYSNWDLMYLPLLLSPFLPLPFYWHCVGLASISTVPFPAHVRWAECCQWDLSFNHWCSGSLAQCHSFTLHPGAFP